MVDRLSGKSRGQIAFEFLVVYSFVLLVFVVLFLLITSERSSSLNAQSYSSLQLIAQDIAGYIDQAVYAGSGYNATIPLAGSVGSLAYNITISTTGVVVVSSKEGTQVVTAYAFSNARNLIINGTYSSTSSNAIALYVLPNTGLFKVSNINGVLFINQKPPATSNLATYLTARVVGKTAAAVFNNAGGYGLISKVATPTSVGALTLTAWVDPSNSFVPRNDILDFENVYLTIQNGNACFEVRGGSFLCSTAIVPSGTWSFIAATYNSPNENIFVGTANTYASSVFSQSAGVSNAAIGYCIYCSPQGDAFNGMMADVQAYNASLSYSQVVALYYEGIGGAPVLTQNTVGWWPLNGNMNDYSGNNNDALPKSIVYNTVVQVNAYPLAQNGSAVYFPSAGFGLPVSQLTTFASSAGSLSANGAVNASFAHSTVSAFLTSNGAKGNVNFVVSEFNGNNTLILANAASPKGLVAWFPLDEGFGNTVTGFGPYMPQLKAAGSYNGFPAWSAMNNNLTNFQVGNFPGNPTDAQRTSGQNGWVSVGYVSAYNNITTSNAFTAVAWIYLKGVTPHYQGIFGDLASPTLGPGFQLSGASPVYGVLDVAGEPVQWPVGNSGNFPINTWLMVTGEYSGVTGIGSVYLNTTLYATNTVGRYLSLSQITPFNIGNDAWESGGLDTFNGMITNVQLYSSALNQSQVNALYTQGPTGEALSGTGLMGWWPLDGSTIDSSSIGNNGTVQYTVNYPNTQYGNYILQGPVRYALTTSPISANAYSGTANVGLGGSSATVMAWINPSQKQSDPSNNIVFDYGPLSCGTPGSGFRLGVQSSGVPWFSAWCDDFKPTSGVAVNFNTWNFVAARLSGQSISIFINGKWENGTLPTTPGLQAGTVVVGGLTATSGLFNGSITDLQVYSIALSPQQITQTYVQGLPPALRMNLSVS